MYIKVVDTRGQKHTIPIKKILEIKENGNVEIFLIDGSSIVTNESYEFIISRINSIVNASSKTI